MEEDHADARQAAAEFIAQNPEVGVAYRHLPLPIHPAAEGAARAAICAQRQRRFEEMHARLFETARWHSDTLWIREGHRGRRSGP